MRGEERTTDTHTDRQVYIATYGVRIMQKDEATNALASEAKAMHTMEMMTKWTRHEKGQRRDCKVSAY